MPDLPTPPAPPSQTELRRWLEDTLQRWEIRYTHQDRFWESDNGREAIYGWGTRIERAGKRGPLRVWFDGLDEDITILGHHRHKEYREWQDLTDLPAVMEEIRATLIHMLKPDAR